MGVVQHAPAVAAHSFREATEQDWEYVTRLGREAIERDAGRAVMALLHSQKDVSAHGWQVNNYQHSLQAARRLGFRAMQFNLVVSTNTAGIRCWQRNGFQVVGTLPGAFRHRRLGYVDALVMVQGLVEGPKP